MPGYLEEIKDLHGTPEKPIVIDGQGVTLDGQYDAVPIWFHDNSYVILRNFNLCRSRANVLWAGNNHHCRFEQICAWDADPSKNFNPFTLSGSTHCQVIDCAAWGSGRKIFSGSQGGDDTSYYRCWGRWERSACPGWKITFATAYNHFRNWFGYCIGECLNLPTVPREFRGVFGDDRIDSGEPANTIMHRCLAISAHDVRGFTDIATRGLLFDRCIDATPTYSGNRADLLDIMSHWSRSPILSRIQSLAGVDVMSQLRQVAFASHDDLPVPLGP